MKKPIIQIFIFILFIFAITGCQQNKPVLHEQKLEFILNQINNVLAVSDSTDKVPRTISEDGNLTTTSIYGWTSGFFAGNLWYLYELTGNDYLMEEGIRWTEALAPVQYFTGHHDIGFMINCSYGNGLRITKNPEYEKVLLQAAKSLTTRFNPVTGVIKSWDYKKSWDGVTEWHYPVIIDNMMNLELLFEASVMSGDKLFHNVALSHAVTTMDNHYRPDFSCYHVVDYDANNGEVLDKATNQGYADQSAWARGQAWGLYGFVVCYRYTEDEKFLNFAENIADYILNHPSMPGDFIPFWDFNVNDKQMIPEWDIDNVVFSAEQRDVSAAAIICSALFELSTLTKNKSDLYFDAASRILDSLSSPKYMPVPASNNFFILEHSVGSIPHGVEIDVPLVYADYYFLEAVLRKQKILQNKKS